MKLRMKMGEKRKRWLITGLQVVFIIAWLPILWLLLSVTLGTLLVSFIGEPWIVHSLVLLFSLLLIIFAFRYLVSLSEEIFTERR